MNDSVTAALLNCVADAIIVVSDQLDVLYANSAAIELLSGDGPMIAPHQVDAGRIVHPDDLASTVEALARSLADGCSSVQIRLLLPSGERPVEVTLTNHVGTDGVNGVVACFRNLEQEHALRASLERQQQLGENILMALTDDLTGMPTRRLFVERLQRSLDACAEERQPVSVIFVDLDGFKMINDSLGHTAGDAMLRSTASKLLSIHADIEHWGRLGGDEFVLFLERCDAQGALEIAHMLSNALRHLMVLGGQSFYSSASIGVAVVEDAMIDAESAVRQADIAMYEGKRGGRNMLTVFTPEMQRNAVVRAELEGQLRRSLIGAGPNVAYQPIINLRTGHTYAVEALARWRSPTLGPIAPERFVAMAEQMGAVDQLDQHVLRKACRATVDQHDPATGLLIDLTVNVSTMHLSTTTFSTNVLATLSETGFDPSRLVIEVTESIAVEHGDLVTEQLCVMNSNGIRIALDDFGTGHSSLAQLEHLAIDLVKIDRTFLQGVPGSDRRLRYIETIVAMANALDLDVIFEGVETLEQARVLVELGVTYGQGYLLARPAGLAELVDRMVHAGDVVTSVTAAKTG